MKKEPTYKHVAVYAVSKPPGWQVQYRANGSLVRKHRTDQQKAHQYASKIDKEIERQVQAHSSTGLVVTDVIRAEWSSCRDLLEPYRITVLEAVRDFVARAKVQNNDFNKPPFAKAVEQFLESKVDIDRKDRTIANLKQRLEALMRRGCDQWTGWNRAELEKAVYSKKLSPRSSINNLAAARAFSRWCVELGWLPVDPTENIKRPTSLSPDPTILKPFQFNQLLEASGKISQTLAAWYAVLCLAGLRTSELKEMSKDLRGCLRNGELLVHRVGRRHRDTRTVPICRRLRKILDNVNWEVEQPNPKKHQRLIKEIGLEWQENICRHSFVSYRLGLIQNRPQVCLEAGHSETTLKRYYVVSITTKEAEEWFGEEAKKKKLK